MSRTRNIDTPAELHMGSSSDQMTTRDAFQPIYDLIIATKVLQPESDPKGSEVAVFAGQNEYAERKIEKEVSGIKVKG